MSCDYCKEESKLPCLACGAPKPCGSTGLSCYVALVAKLDEYVVFLSKGAMMDALHGGCTMDEFEIGERLRDEILELRKAT